MLFDDLYLAPSSEFPEFSDLNLSYHSFFLEHHGPAFDEFMDIIGEKVLLKGFEGYKAQLDNKSKFHPERRFLHKRRMILSIFSSKFHSSKFHSYKSPPKSRDNPENTARLLRGEAVAGKIKLW